MSTYAITAVSFGRRAIFTRTVNAELLVATLFRYRDQGHFFLHGFVVMPEHLHVLLTTTQGLTLEKSIQLIKGGFSFAVRTHFQGDVWQAGYHDHRVRDAEDFRNQLAYIAENPIRRRLADHPFVHTRYQDRIDPAPEHFRV